MSNRRIEEILNQEIPVYDLKIEDIIIRLEPPKRVTDVIELEEHEEFEPERIERIKDLISNLELPKRVSR